MAIRIPVLLMLWIGSVAILSLWPFGPLDSSWTEFARRLAAGIGPSVGWPLWETVSERLLAFLPIGFLLYGWFRRLAVRAAASRALAAAAAVALVIEMAQGAVESRHARLSDLAFAVVAAALGTALGAFVRRNPEPRHRFLFACLFVGGSLLAAMIPPLAQLGLRIDGWDCSYPLILGNELTGDRPWLGSIAGYAIYPRALPDAEIRTLAVPGPAGWKADPRTAAGAILVRRSAQPPLRFGAEATASLRSSIDRPDAAARPRVTTLDGATSRGVCEAISESRAFTVELLVRSADPNQFGPARIISMSQDTMLRNFTVGQEGAEIVFRVRTPRSGSNGRILERKTSNRALRPGWHHVVARYDDQGGSIFVDGAAVTPPTRHRDTFSVPPFQYPVRLIWIVASVGLGAGACAALAFPRLGRNALLVTTVSGAMSGVIAGLAGAWGAMDPFLPVAAAVPPSVGCAIVLGLSARRGRGPRASRRHPGLPAQTGAHPATCRMTSRKRLPKAFQFKRSS